MPMARVREDGAPFEFLDLVKIKIKIKKQIMRTIFYLYINNY